MSVEVDFLDCCDNPVLKIVKKSRDDHDSKSLFACSNCGSYWFYRFYKHTYFDADLPDSQIEWYVSLSKQEAQDLISEEKAIKLAGRRCFHVDEGKVSFTDYPLL